MGTPRPDRNLALELVRVTEAAAMGAGRWVGRGDKLAADQAAVDAMRAMLDTVVMDGLVVIGEGEKDEAPMLYNGERVGQGEGPEVDVAVDPLEGTRLTALGQPNAIAVIAVAERGSMFFPGAAVYMEKIAAGADAVDVIDINATPTENVQAVAKAKGRRVDGHPRGRARARPARRADRGAARGGGQGEPDPRRRRRAGDRRGAPRDRRRPALRRRRHAARVSSRPRRSSASAAASRASSGRATTVSGRRSSRRATTSTAC